MIISRLNGGLGNQMFQYAFGRKVALMNKSIFLLDLNEFKLDGFRKCGIFDFKITAEEAMLKDIFKISISEAVFYFLSLNKITKKIVCRTLLSKIRGNVHSRYFPKSHATEPLYLHSIASQRKMEYDEDYLLIHDNSLLSGTWMSHFYFEDIKDILKKEFTLKNKTERFFRFSELCHRNPIVGIHVRKTDKVSDPEYYNFGNRFYMKAIDFFLKRYENLQFAFFSDDINWVKENISFDDAIYITDEHNASPAEDLMMLSQCTHFVCPCSSFSWWAAWLGETAKSCVLMPPSRFWSRTSLDYSTVSPQNWIELPMGKDDLEDSDFLELADTALQ